MSFLPTYSSRAVVVNYSGKDLDGGRPDEAFITVSRNAPRASFRAGLSGDKSASLSADSSLTITLSFFPESASAKFLTGVYAGLQASEQLGNPVLGAVPLGITDPTGSTVVLALEAVLMEMGDTTLGEDTGTIDFMFYVESGAQVALPTDVAVSVAEALDTLSI